MKPLATIGDNCVDIYPQLNKAFSGGNAVNVAVYCTRYGIQPGCITWVGDDDYGTKLKQDLARMGVDISHVHTKHGVTAQTQVELHDNDRVFGDYTEGVMADFALSEEDYAWLAQYDIVHAYSAAIFLIPICISFDTAEKRRYATYLILNRRFSFEF